VSAIDWIVNLEMTADRGANPLKIFIACKTVGGLIENVRKKIYFETLHDNATNKLVISLGDFLKPTAF
jgi:hypothetical protein